MRFRIASNLGDVLAAGERIYRAGMNITTLMAGVAAG
jgi:hypothetical protein